MRRTFAVLSLAVMMAVSMVGTALADGHEAQVSVIHGIPGLTVDVYVNDALTIEDFAPGTVAGPLTLAAGDYDLALTAPDDPVASAILTASATVTGGTNVSIIAHLLADGTPNIAVFGNDISEIAAGESRLTVRHAAAAPEVDIVLADDTILFENVPNGAEGIVDVAAATYSVAVTPTGAGVAGAVFGPLDVELPEGTNRIVYATGDLEGGTFGLVIQDISGLAAAPAAVPTGSGLAGPAFPWTAAGLLVLALIGAGVAVPALSRKDS